MFMSFNGLPFEGSEHFPKQEAVLQYLNKYADHFTIRDFIQVSMLRYC